MKKFLSAVAIIVTSFNGFSQQQPPPVEQRSQMIVEKLSGEIKLNETQKAETGKVFFSFLESFDAFRDKGAPPTKEEIKAVVEKRNDSLKKIFTEDQYKKFIDFEESMKKQKPKD